MRLADTLGFAGRSATGYPLRTALLVLAMAIGVAAVVVLTALGDGARRYVIGEFSALGSNLVIVLPGRSETGGFNPANVITATPRDLTLEDAEALLRLPAVRRMAPIVVGTSEAAHGGVLREVTVAGSNADLLHVRQFKLAQGRFLAADNLGQGAAEAVLGATIRAELFGAKPALGQVLRVGDRRFRVVGVLAASGSGLGMNADELVILPAAHAQAMFNTGTVFRILVEARNRDALDDAQAQARRLLTARHDGEEDFTIITQDAVLATFDKLLGALTLAVAGIAAVSLAVAGILVMNVMLVAVSQRVDEIGLLKALGARDAHIRQLFLAEAALLSLAGALAGLALGHGGAFLLRLRYPALPAWPPDWAVWAGLATALGTGLLFGVLPARRAARLDPVAALARR